MQNDAARLAMIPAASSAKKPRLFTSIVSATAFVALFVVLGVNLLAQV